MKFGLIFSALGATLIYAGANTGSPLAIALFLYAALSCLALGLAYFLNRPQILLKRADGRLHWLSWILFAPYHLNNHLFLEVFRRTSSKPRWTEIIPGLWLGGRLRPGDEARLRNAGFGRSAEFQLCANKTNDHAEPDRRAPAASVLDVTGEFAEVPWLRRLPRYRCIPLLDTTAPTPAQLRESTAFIQEQLPRGPVYVHCAFGHSRSAAFVIGWLVSSGRYPTVSDAIAFVQSKRPRVRLNAAQWHGLRTYFDRA